MIRIRKYYTNGLDVIVRYINGRSVFLNEEELLISNLHAGFPEQNAVLRGIHDPGRFRRLDVPRILQPNDRLLRRGTEAASRPKEALRRPGRDVSRRPAGRLHRPRRVGGRLGEVGQVFDLR